MRKTTFALPLAFPLGLAAAALWMTGCSMTTTAINQPAAGAAVAGKLFGGQQGITAAHIYMFAAGQGGIGAASQSLLSGAVTGHSDAVGGYVLSSTGGFFTIPAGSYSCTAGAPIYLYSLGGDPGGGANSAAGLIAVLGVCGTGGALPGQVLINEVSTIAAAYAISGFATDATHVSSTASALGIKGIQTAFGNAAQLVTLANGTALTATPNGNGVVPQKTIYTLANILAGCVNSTGPGTGGCTSLFGAVKSGGTTGTQATETATEAIYIAHNPGSNVGGLFNLASNNTPFSPVILGTAPNDWTIGINYTGGGISGPEGIAIDAAGDAWVANSGGNSVTALSPTGVPLASSPYTAGGINSPQGIAIDALGAVWVTNYNNNSVTKLASNGLSGTNTTSSGAVQLPGGVALDTANSAWVTSLAGSPYPALIDFASTTSTNAAYAVGVGGMNVTQGIAIDTANHEWVSNNGGTVTELLAGVPVAGTPFGTGSLAVPTGVAIDSSGNAWVADAANQAVTKIGPGGGSLAQYTGGGLDGSIGIAIDGAQNVFLANNTGLNGSGVDGVSGFNASGAAASPASGYLGGGLFFPYAVAVDGSGNVWATNPNGANGVGSATGSVTELIGAGVPVVTPIVASLSAPYKTAASLP